MHLRFNIHILPLKDINLYYSTPSGKRLARFLKAIVRHYGFNKIDPLHPPAQFSLKDVSITHFLSRE